MYEDKQKASGRTSTGGFIIGFEIADQYLMDENRISLSHW